ncbi:MAG: acyl-CoA desaturase [Pseudomonadota bacterium]
MNEKEYKNPRIDHEHQHGDPSTGLMRLDIAKVLWLVPMFILGTVGSLMYISLEAVVVFIGFTLANICFGHSLGMHRLLIHRSFRCPRWLEYFLVHLGTIAGIAGPLTMMRTHDIRDWAQRQSQCHSFFTQVAPWHVDLYRQLFCSIELDHPPVFIYDTEVASNSVYQWMERTWRWQQLPWAVLLFAMGGIGWVLWGICSRVSAIVVGHWLIGYFAHNQGDRDWEVDNAAVQGHNVPWCSLLTMGECWHNNHHAFPGSARMGLNPGQWDLGWSVLCVLERIGVVSDIKTPDKLPYRDDLTRLD